MTRTIRWEQKQFAGSRDWTGKGEREREGPLKRPHPCCKNEGLTKKNKGKQRTEQPFGNQTQEGGLLTTVQQRELDLMVFVLTMQPEKGAYSL